MSKLSRSPSQVSKLQNEKLELQQQASIERHKRLEEERKRKLLEKEITKLKEQNKKLKQPKAIKKSYLLYLTVVFINTLLEGI